MKKTTAKIVTISDLIQWNEKQEIELSPKYQRNNVWNERAKAYLIDTIVRGLPIPPIFMRQQVDVNTKTTHREIIDGQQRVRAIIEFVVAESFAIRKNHNKQLGGKKYSDLNPEDQEAILEYEILAEVVTEKDDSVVYDMFARLNSNNIVLNKQEIRNSKFWGDFKVLVYRLSSKYRDFFLEYGLFDDKDCARMKDSEFINSLLILITEGIVAENPTYIDGIYKKYDQNIPNAESVEKQFVDIMSVLENVYMYFNGNMGCFGNKNYFYTLYAVVLHQMFGIKGFEAVRLKKYTDASIWSSINCFNNSVSEFISDYNTNLKDKDNMLGHFAEYTLFATNHKSRTTSKAERIQRITFLTDAIERIENDNE